MADFAADKMFASNGVSEAALALNTPNCSTRYNSLGTPSDYHKARRETKSSSKKFKKFNFTFNINYLFYLFKHRILIILNSPRVCCCRSLLFRALCCLKKKFSIYPSTQEEKRILFPQLRSTRLPFFGKTSRKLFQQPRHSPFPSRFALCDGEK